MKGVVQGDVYRLTRDLTACVSWRRDPSLRATGFELDYQRWGEGMSLKKWLDYSVRR